MASLLAVNAAPLTGARAPALPCRRTSPRSARALRVVTKASLDAGTTLAVTQQAAAYAACVAGEVFYTRSITEEGTAGRPEVIPTLPCAGGILAAVLLCQNDLTVLPGLAIGGGLSSYLLYEYGLRIRSTKHDPREWPGPKAWPAGMALVSFFAVNIFFQGLTN